MRTRNSRCKPWGNLALLVVGSSVVGISYYLIGDNDEPSAVTPKDIFTLSRDQIVEVYDGDTFKSIYFSASVVWR